MLNAKNLVDVFPVHEEYMKKVTWQTPDICIKGSL